MTDQINQVDQPKTPIDLNELELGTVLRSKTLGVYKVSGSKAWGKYLSKIPDPEGITIPKRVINNFTLKPDFPKIPAEQWARYVSLCFYMCPPGTKKLSTYEHDSQLEVSVCFLRDQATLTKWKIVVPKQTVSGTQVTADLQHCIDIETGEEYDVFPPLGWLHAGSSHSHNTMRAFYSSIDDASELSCPGLHIVVGEIDHQAMEYSHIASVVLQKQRKLVSLYDVVDAEPKADCPFHDKVLGYIKVVIEKNKKLWARSSWASTHDNDDDDRPRWKFPGKRYSPPPPVEDGDGKINNFFRSLDRNNSDLFDNLSEDVDIFSLTDRELKILAKEEGLTSDLSDLASQDELDVSDEEMNDLILRELSRMERGE